MRIHLDKIASITRNLNLGRWVTLSPEVEAREGAVIAGRIDSADWFQDGKARWPSGYVLTVQPNGSWELDNSKFRTPIAKLAAGKVAFSLKTWHRLALAFRGSTIEASIDGARVASLSDETHKKGMAGIGTGWNNAQFADFAVK